MRDDEFLNCFENAALPRGEWNHAAHLRMAYFYLQNADSWEEILPTVRERIRAFRPANGELFEGTTVLLRHYDKTTLFSPEARAGFMAPDRRPLP